MDLHLVPDPSYFCGFIPYAMFTSHFVSFRLAVKNHGFGNEKISETVSRAALTLAHEIHA